MSLSQAQRSEAEPQKAKPEDDLHLIVVEDAEIKIEHHPEDWVSFLIFWSLAIIVFMQFFTRYVLNDSLAWTEEIARYGLMWITFIGGAIIVRKNSHIAVELVTTFLPPRATRALVVAIDCVKLLFLALLAYFAFEIVGRMQYQRMTVFDLPMSLVYGGILVGCVAMFLRQLQIFVRNARDGWRTAHLGAGIVLD
jgi:TRAP-type C4-dicarboxylate transport system permease small subunit